MPRRITVPGSPMVSRVIRFPEEDLEAAIELLRDGETLSDMVRLALSREVESRTDVGR